MIKIAVDAMGGDNFPQAPVKGALLALKEVKNLKIVFVGDKNLIEKELERNHFKDYTRIEIHHTKDYIRMDVAQPAKEVKANKFASINEGMKLLRDDHVKGLVSAGNTGAYMASSLFLLGRIKGVLRPAITAVFPTKKLNKGTVVLDLGANADCKSEHLEQFGILGSIFAQDILNIEKPKVALLNIGEEESKGNTLQIESFSLLSKNKNINFIGNIEPNQIIDGSTDVVIMDGFSGNIMLKTSEAAFSLIKNTLVTELKRNIFTMMIGLFLKNILKKFSNKLDIAEYGGAMILGVNGIVLKTHGNSDGKAIKNSIKLAYRFAEKDVVDQIKKSILNTDGNRS